jgi:thioredoxin-related protein
LIKTKIFPLFKSGNWYAAENKEVKSMKNLFYLFALVLIAIACVFKKPEKEEIKFVNQAVVRARKANKLLIVEFWAPECNSCMKLNHDIFNNDKTREFLDKNFILVRLSPADSVYKPLWDHYSLKIQSTVIFLDKNGNEIDRSVGYDGNKDTYLDFLREVSEGRNLYSVVFSCYKKDTLFVPGNYVLAKKLFFRNQIKDALKQFNNVLLYDPDNRYGYNADCAKKINECRQILTDTQPLHNH